MCTLLSKTHKTIRHWRKLYETGGVNRLLSLGSGRGRKAQVKDVEQFTKDLEALQAERSGGRIVGQDVVELIAQKYGISYRLSSIYPLLHRLGFSWITARSKHPKQDLAAQEAFKKTL